MHSVSWVLQVSSTSLPVRFVRCVCFCPPFWTPCTLILDTTYLSRIRGFSPFWIPQLRETLLSRTVFLCLTIHQSPVTSHQSHSLHFGQPSHFQHSRETASELMFLHLLFNFQLSTFNFSRSFTLRHFGVLLNTTLFIFNFSRFFSFQLSTFNYVGIDRHATDPALNSVILSVKKSFGGGMQGGTLNCPSRRAGPANK